MKEQVLHGEFKQTYVTTIEVVLSMIKELARLMDKIPAAKVVPAFEESRMFPAGYPKELPRLKQPGPRHHSPPCMQFTQSLPDVNLFLYVSSLEQNKAETCNRALLLHIPDGVPEAPQEDATER